MTIRTKRVYFCCRNWACVNAFCLLFDTCKSALVSFMCRFLRLHSRSLTLNILGEGSSIYLLSGCLSVCPSSYVCISVCLCYSFMFSCLRCLLFKLRGMYTKVQFDSRFLPSARLSPVFGSVLCSPPFSFFGSRQTYFISGRTSTLTLLSRVTDLISWLMLLGCL